MTVTDGFNQHEGNLRIHLKAAGIKCEGGPAQWTNNNEIKAYIRESLIETAKTGGLDKSALIGSVVLTPEEW